MSASKTGMWVDQRTISPKEKCVLCTTALNTGGLVIQLECGCKVRNSCFNAYCERNTKEVVNGILSCPKCGKRLINSADYCMSAWAYEKGALDKETTDTLKTFTPSTRDGKGKRRTKPKAKAKPKAKSKAKSKPKAKGKTKRRTGKRRHCTRRR